MPHSRSARFVNRPGSLPPALLCRLLSLSAALMLLGGPVLSARAQETPASSWCVSVWYPSSEHPGGYDSLLTHLDIIDEVNPFWYAANADGTLLRHAGAEDAEKLSAWRAAGLRILPTIANASPLAISDPQTRAQHIEHIVALVTGLDYDGIDIDYEEFPLSTRDDFSLFIETLAARLHAEGRLLSIAVHAKTEDFPAWEGAAAQDWARLSAAVDIFRIMTYDYHSRVSRDPGPIGPPDWAADVLAYAATVTDLAKVRLGLHFYGYRWQRGGVSPVTWESVQRAVTAYGLTVQRDPDSQEAWVTIAQRGLPKQTIYVADAVALDFKLGRLLAQYPTLGGVAIWGLGGEDPANWDILRRYERGPCLR
jgi:spore germination protein YaaH